MKHREEDRVNMAGGLDAKRLARVTEALSRDVDTGRIHGAAMQVSRRGEMIVDFLGGYADKAAGLPLRRDSVFATMSVAKLFVSVLALSLVERGLLRLHSPVADVIPEFAQFGKEKVNLFHLLTHTSGGMRGVPPIPGVLTDIEKMTAYACSLPLDFRPSERVSYSLVIAHAVIAAMCLRVDGRGRRFATMLAEDLFRPLGMKDTSLGPREDLLPRICPVRVAQVVPNVAAPSAEYMEKVLFPSLLEPGAEFAAGGCFTTMHDARRFIEMLRRGGELDGTRILSPAMITFCARNYTGQMREAAWDGVLSIRHWQSFPANMGIGVDVRGEDPVRPGPFGTLNSPETFGRFGAGSTGIWVDPKNELSYALLTTGLLDESYNFERTALLSDLVMSAVIE